MPQQDTVTQASASASSYRQRTQQGTIWHAPSGEAIRVRDIDIADHAVLNQFPDNLRQVVYRGIERSASLKPSETPEDDDIDVFAGLSGEDLLKSQGDIAIQLCKMGWIMPRVVDVVEDEDTEISVDELLKSDARAYMTHVFGSNAMEAQALAPFPGGSPGSVRPVPGLPGVPRPAVPTAPAGDPRILARDSV